MPACSPPETSKRNPLFLITAGLLFTAALCTLAFFLSDGYTHRNQTNPTGGIPSAPAERPFRCVVIDAGHGGEDGGAVSRDGLNEKDVNLAVALALRDLLEANGIPTVMTRTEDRLLYDRHSAYHGHKKSLDLAARRLIAEQTPDCLFVSIHMNAFPDPRCQGIQVWYGTVSPISQRIASSIQTQAAHLQPENHRKIKPADSRIYLLDHLSCPVVLVECGFLSNPNEAEKLSDPLYQQTLAFLIFTALADISAE